MSVETDTYANRKGLLGIRVDALSMRETVTHAAALIDSRTKGHQHVVVNAAKVVAASRDEQLRSTINGADIINADGQAIVWAARILGQHLPERVTGIDFMNEMLRRAPQRRWRVYLLGATQEVLNAVSKNLTDSAVDIVGAADGFWRQEKSDQRLVGEIASTNPDLLFVALPSPMKEDFLRANLPQLNVGLAVGVGGTFDIIAGKTKRAPKHVQRLGLEWLHRLAQEPRRMFVRYAKGNALFASLVVRELITRRRGE